MKSTIIVAAASLAAVVSGHGVILSAQGTNSKVASVGMQVVLSLARNCTSISPCQQDTSLIRDAEINANVVNECGRTELAGNIDVGENTENQLAAGQVADVTAGDTVNVTIHQVNADGAGPYTCDLDETSNTGIFSHTNLAIENNVPGANGLSQAKEQDFNMQVKLPANMNCTGASTGNICTLRCRNNALAGPFGGCVALQQTDSGTGRASPDPSAIDTNITLAEVASQVEFDKQDINAAIAANQAAGADEADQGVKAANALIAAAGLNPDISSPTSKAAPVASSSPTAAAAAGAGAGAATGAGAGTGAASSGNNNNGNANANNGGGNAGNAEGSRQGGKHRGGRFGGNGKEKKAKRSFRFRA